MELCTVEKWQQVDSVEVFFNTQHRHLVFKKFNYIYSKDIHDRKSQSYIDLQNYEGPILSCSFSLTYNVFAFQRSQNEIVTPKKEFLIVDSNIHFSLPAKSKVFLGYHWLSQSLYSDLVIIDSAGVEFFKIFPKQGKILSVRNYPISVGHYWFDSNEGVLVVASSPPKLGLFSTFFINQAKGPKFFNGQRVNINLSPSVTNMWTETCPHISCLIGKIEPASYSNSHYIRLVFLYSSTYLIHINCLEGSLSFYKLTHEKVAKVADSVQVPSGSYGVRTYDNILILQNYTLQESYLIDIKSKKYGFSIFFTFWNGMKKKVSLSISVRLVEYDGNIWADSDVLYNGTAIKRSDSTFSLSSFKAAPAAAECYFSLEGHAVYVDNDVCLDTSKGRCYRLVLHPIFITENHPDQVEAILFLLRRNNSKNIALQYIRRAMRNLVDCKVLAELFSVLANFYKIAAVEKKNKQNQQKKPVNMERTNSFSSETDMMVDEGILVLQSELLGLIFLPLYEEGFLDIKYLNLYLQTYIRSLWNEDLQVQLNMQVLLMKVLFKGKEFSQAEQLLQHNVFHDSLDVCNLLLAYCEHYKNFWHIGIDMLIRLKMLDRLIDVLNEKGFYLESFNVVERKDSMKFDMTKVINTGYQEIDQDLINFVKVLVKEWTLKNSS